MELQELRNREVSEDSKLLEQEKETYLHITGDNQKEIHITSNMKPFIKFMLECEDLDPTRVYTDTDGNINHLEGKLPISHLRLKQNGSNSMNYISRILG